MVRGYLGPDSSRAVSARKVPAAADQCHEIAARHGKCEWGCAGMQFRRYSNTSIGATGVIMTNGMCRDVSCWYLR